MFWGRDVLGRRVWGRDGKELVQGEPGTVSWTHSEPALLPPRLCLCPQDETSLSFPSWLQHAAISTADPGKLSSDITFLVKSGGSQITHAEHPKMLNNLVWLWYEMVVAWSLNKKVRRLVREPQLRAK